MKHTTVIVALLAVAGLAALPGDALGQDPALVERGAAVYASRCVICHGADGDGKGLTGIIHRAQQNGVVIAIYPRDFTAGTFKFRSTPSGSLPTDEDLMRTITEGISRSGMPSHSDLSLADRRAVIEFIKTFSPKWQRQKTSEPIDIGSVPDYVATSESVDKGREAYALMQCSKCHGELGRGDGPSSGVLEDSWGDPILPFDFTSGPLKGGATADAIYRTFVTGLD
ncbi:MAG: cytochrome c, partial [bacterium]|nr:cytochrome c [bacterium]